MVALALDEQVVSLFHTVPTFVAVHCIEAADDGSNVCSVGITDLLDVGDEAGAALRVGVTAVHEAVYVDILQIVFLADFNQFEEMIQ